MSAPTSTEVSPQTPTRTVSVTARAASMLLATPVALLGVLALLGNLAILFVTTTQEHWITMPWSFRIWEIELRVVAAAAGAICLVSALQFLRRRWLIACALLAVGIVVMIVNPIIQPALRHHFAGDEFTVPPSYEVNQRNFTLSIPQSGAVARPSALPFWPAVAARVAQSTDVAWPCRLGI
jgi:hypothetical protein